VSAEKETKEMETKTIKKHAVLSIPVLGAVLLMIHSYMVSGFVFEIPGDLLDKYIADGAYGFLDLFSAIGGICILFIHKFWFRDEFNGCFRKDCGDRKFKCMVFGYVVFDLAVMLFSYIGNSLAIPTLKLTFMAIKAGVCEEVTFRALPISISMRSSDNKKCIVIAVAVSSVLFGVTHSLNVLGGGDLFGMILMVVRTFGVGVLYAAIFLRTGNILITIAMHAFHDYIAFLPFLGSTDVTTHAVSSLITVLIIVYTILTVVFAVFLLKGHSDEIMTVWRERWNKEEKQPMD